MRPKSTSMHFWALSAMLTAHLPIALTDFRTKSTSISVLYSLNSNRSWSMFSAFASLIRASSFSILT